MQGVLEISKALGISREILLQKGIISFLEKEIRLSEEEIANIRERYDCLDCENLERKIRKKEINSHPAWEDCIVWKNKDSHIKELKKRLSELL